MRSFRQESSSGDKKSPFLHKHTIQFSVGSLRDHCNQRSEPNHHAMHTRRENKVCVTVFLYTGEKI